jgi:catechol 2,3-dioxygenase-like lactoylglutathione lyase family enzyme
MEVNGIAHIFLTASNYERSRDFYRKLLPFLGLKPVIDTETTYYCVGGRTAVGINAPSAEHEGAAFEQKRVGLHHLCFRARERADVDELHAFLTTLGAKSFARRARIGGRRDIIRSCSRIPTASGSSSIMCRGRGCWGDSGRELRRMGRAKRNPSCLRAMIDGFRCVLPILRTGCAMLLDANRARIKIQLLSSCYALLGSEHCNRAPLSQEIES